MIVMKRVGLVGAVALTLSGAALADDTMTNDELRARLLAAEAKIAELESQQSTDWLTEQRAEQIRGLVQDVLADADTRASLMQSGMTAGYDNGFMIGSTDGNWSLKINGELQSRFIYNNQDMSPAISGGDDNRWGFENTRTKLIFTGNVVDPSWTYRIEGNFDRDGGSFGLDDAWIRWDYGSGWGVKFGQFKVPLLREELVWSGHQLAVERSVVNEGYTAGRSQGLMIEHTADQFRLSTAYTDGYTASDGTVPNTDFANTPWNDYTTEYSLGGRLELLLMGNWSQFDDFTSFPGDEQGWMLGVAWNSQRQEFGTAVPIDELEAHAITVDLSAEFGGANAFLAFIYRNLDNDASGAAAVSADQFAIVVQGGYFFTDDWEGFVRYEWSDLDLPDTDDLSILTVGINRYFSGHNLKWTTDVAIGIEEVGVVTPNITGLRTDAPGEDGQVAVRTQLQLLF